MSKFSITDYVKPEELVSKSDTEPDGVKLIPLEEIAENERNFYELSDMDALKDSIALNGLIEPVIVVPFEDGDYKYKLVSGHRRYNAFLQLRDDSAGDDLNKYGSIPAIVRQPMSEVVEELMLIEANRATRKLSSADIMMQAERYGELLAKLKDSGVEIPGRMRDAVAQAMEVSASKLARLSAIKNNLIPEALELFKANKLSESTAYKLSQAPAGIQKRVLPTLDKDSREWEITSRIENFKSLDSIKCENGVCKNTAGMLKANARSYCYGVHYGKCCRDCSYLSCCENSCPDCAEEKAKLKAEADEEKQKSKEQAAKKEQEAMAERNRIWARMKEARLHAGKSIEDVIKAIDWLDAFDFNEPEDIEEYERFENGNCDHSYEAGIYDFDEFYADEITQLADLYGCSVDYLLLRTDIPSPEAKPPREGWHRSKPENDTFIVGAQMTNDGWKVAAGWYIDGQIVNDRHGKARVLMTHVTYWMPSPAVDNKDTPEEIEHEQ